MLNTKTIFGTVLITVLAAALPAPAQAIGDWFVNIESQTAYSAITVNESGHTFGEFCDLGEGDCSWLIEMSSSCHEGAKSPVLANSDGLPVYLEVLCIGRLEGGSSYAYAFTDFDQVDKLVRHSDRVAFAVPSEGEEFQIVKYNLRGTVDALSVMLAATNKRLKSVPSNSRHNRV